MARQQYPGQDALFLTHPRVGEQLQHDDPEALSALSRRAHLIEAIDSLGQASSAFALGKAVSLPEVERDLESRYGGQASSVVEGSVTKTGPKAVRSAKYSFARATGLFERIDELGDNEAAIAQAKAETRAQYEAFVSQYYGAANADARNAYRAQLLAEIRDMTLDSSAARREEGQRFDIDGLDTRGRLLAIQHDPRAGFLPATNLEKNLTIAWLDYLDDPEYPLGIANELLEIANAQNRLFPGSQEIDGERSKESIIYVLADFYQNARDSVVGLEQLYEAIAPVNPKLPLGLLSNDEIDPGSMGIRAVSRHIDILTVANGEGGRVVTWFRNPLRSITERKTTRGPGRHKQIQDRYTGLRIDERTLAEIQFFAGQLAAGEAKRLVAHALSNEIVRRAFHEVRLVELSQVPSPRQVTIRSVARGELDRIREDSKRVA